MTGSGGSRPSSGIVADRLYGKQAWDELLQKIDDERARLRCSHSNAWYRGISDSNYQLKPSLFRINGKSLESKENNDSHKSYDDGLSRQYRKLVSQRSELRRSFSDTSHSLEGTSQNPAQISGSFRNSLNLMSQRDHDGSPEAISRTSLEFKKIKEKMAAVQTKKRDIRRKQRERELYCTGEREAYIDYCFRSGQRKSSSWEILAEMQHHGVPTRLLDWTEVLAIAFFFAFRKDWDEILQWWKNPDVATIPNIENKPAIWVLNPYHVSRITTRHLRIWDLTQEPNCDYYDRFIVKKDWHFEKPIPMYSSWKNARLAAQQGMFTVSGYQRSALNEIFPCNVLTKVEIEREAMIYGVLHLHNLSGINHFMLFRDSDSLGKEIKKNFIERQ